jgi:inorganic triphosphatase YgiF
VALEVELKLSIAAENCAALARAAPVKSAGTGRATTAHLYSVYYDTPGFALRQHAVALRLRRIGKRWVQTLKAGGRVEAGLHQREEIETPVAAQIINLQALSESGVADVLTDPQIASQLTPVFITDFRRTTRLLEPVTGTRIELCLDRGAITAGGLHARISEIELELKAGSRAHLIEFAQALLQHVPLRLERASKAERGYLLAASAVPLPVKARPIPLSEQLGVPDALRAIAYGCIDHLQANEQGVLDSEDIEYMHQARVAVRRLRSAFSIFRPAFPSEMLEPWIDELRWLARTLGDARDWDVLMSETLPAVCEALPSEPGLHQLMERCVDLQAAARRGARDAVASKRYTATLLGLLGFFLRAPWQVAEDIGAAERARPLVEFAGAVLDDRHRKVVKHGAAVAKLDAAQLHALRIRVKKLRYAAEFFATLYPRKDVRPYVDALSDLQELLGTLNDAATADRIARALRDEGDTGQVEGLGLLRGWCAARGQVSRKQLGKAWARFEKCARFW